MKGELFKGIGVHTKKWHEGSKVWKCAGSMGDYCYITYYSTENQVIPHTLCMVVGRKDIKGNEIFFDDIVREKTIYATKVKGRVVYVNGVVCIDNILHPLWNYEVEVIGDIHDNEK